MFRPLALLLLVGLPTLLSAQVDSVFPRVLYVGDNVITISNGAGIESIRGNPSLSTAINIPAITGCPRVVTVQVQLKDASVDETAELSIRSCDGSFATVSLRTENWTIRHENAIAYVGSDTCLSCEIVTSTYKVVDSIVVRDARFRVEMPPGNGPWTVPPANGAIAGFHYRVCYRPSGEESINAMILLFMRREQPNRGLTEYVIEKPVTAVGLLRPPPPRMSHRDSVREREALLPSVTDPTTFRTVLAPTAETLGAGEMFAGVFDIAGLLAGYGLTSDLMIVAGGAFVPAAITELGVATTGVKWRFASAGKWQASAGMQLGLSSTSESAIRVASPFATLSYGDRHDRLSLSVGYAWKHHRVFNGFEFNRDAAIVTFGGDATIGRGWKIAAETYYVESSGLAPVTLVARWFTNTVAVDAGFILDVGGGTDIRSTGGLSGEIRDLRLAPLVSAVWRFGG